MVPIKILIATKAEVARADIAKVRPIGYISKR
jgi:hypothetical protein